MKALIVDDERLARSRLRKLLGAHDEINVVAEASSVDSALKAIDEHQPDVVFLDISMPGESGFDLLSKRRIDATIVFVTAHDEHALKAFEVGALDYLLKPIEPPRLTDCVARLGRIHASAEPSVDRITLSSANGVSVVNVHDIALVRSKGDYSELIFLDRRVLVRSEPLSHWETRLGDGFFRVHRSALVALAHVERVEKAEGSTSRLFVRDRDEPIAVSRARVSALKTALKPS